MHKKSSHFYNQHLLDRNYSFIEPCDIYRQTSNVSRTKSQNLNVSRLVLQLS